MNPRNVDHVVFINKFKSMYDNEPTINELYKYEIR